MTIAGRSSSRLTPTLIDIHMPEHTPCLRSLPAKQWSGVLSTYAQRRMPCDARLACIICPLKVAAPPDGMKMVLVLGCAPTSFSMSLYCQRHPRAPSALLQQRAVREGVTRNWCTLWAAC
jgi:hypothetical protein